MAYAERTTIAFDKSISEIMAMLRKCGAAQFGQYEQPQGFTIQFSKDDRLVRFAVQFPEAPTVAKTEQAKRQRGRALFLVIKAKLESVESKVETFEEAFLANVVMADGKTLYERVKAPIALEYQSGVSSPLMLEGPKK